MNYAAYQLVSICILTISVVGLSLVVNMCGRLSLCQGGLFGVGAFTAALALTRSHVGFLPAVAAAGMMSGGLALVLGTWLVRLKKEQFLLASLAVQAVLFTGLYNTIDLTGGPSGISGIPRPEVPRWFVAPELGGSGLGSSWISSETSTQFLLVAVPMCLLSIGLVVQVRRSPFGRVLAAVRDDELAASALGRNPMTPRLAAFALSGVLAGFAGALFASFHTYIDATSFGIEESIFLVSIVALGAPAGIAGQIAAVAIVVLLMEVLKLAVPQSTHVAHVREVAFGLCLIVVAIVRTGGPERRRSRA